MDQPISPAAKTLERVLSKAGLGSRTDARSWIHERRVTVNGAIVENPEHWVDFDTDRVELDGRVVKPLQRLYVLLYKPTGFITSKGDPEGRPTVYDLLKEVPSFVGTVGRLDEDTSGLLLLTNDTILAERMTNPEYHVPKKYLVKCASLLTDEQIEQLRVGIELNDGMTRSASVVRVRDSGPKTFIEITITEGRNRQVRRMIEALDSKVLKLVRTELGPLKLDGLKSGKWRKLTAREVQTLYVMTKLTEARAEIGDSEEDELILEVGPADFKQQEDGADGPGDVAAPVARDSWNKGPKVKGTKEVSLPFAGPKPESGEQRVRSTGSYDKGPRDFSDKPQRPPYGGGQREGGDQRSRSTGSYNKGPRDYGTNGPRASFSGPRDSGSDQGPRDFSERPPRAPYGGQQDGGDQRPRSTGSYNKGPRDYGTNGPRASFSGPRESSSDQRPRNTGAYGNGPKDFGSRPPRPPYSGDSARSFGARPPRAPFSGPRDSGGDSRPRSTGAWDKGPKSFGSKGPGARFSGPRDASSSPFQGPKRSGPGGSNFRSKRPGGRG